MRVLPTGIEHCNLRHTDPSRFRTESRTSFGTQGITSVYRAVPPELSLMAEVPNSGEDHCQPKTVRSFDDFGITNRAAGLDDGSDAVLRSFFDTVREGEERVR